MTGRRAAIIVVAAAVCLAAGALTVKWRADRAFLDPTLQLSRFPVENAAVLSIDVTALRRGGFLTPSRAALEPEYKQFLDGSGFDYHRDLDQLWASFSASGSFFIARGRFDWAKIRAFAQKQGGSCYEELCRIQGSKPERHISFLALRNDTMALAVSTDDLAAARLTKTGQRITTPLPQAPVWFSMPGEALHQPGILPPAVGGMLTALRSADRLILTMQAAPSGAEAHIEATCRTTDDAGVLTSQLRNTIGFVKEGLAQNRVAADDELARALAGGTFDQTGTRVAGRWLVPRALLESLTSGI